MKYYFAILILSLGFLLTGYKDSGKTSNTSNASAWTRMYAQKDDVHEDGDLTSRELNIINNDLDSMEYYGFLLSDYDDPKYIDWNEVFYNGAGLDEVKSTKAIRQAYLRQTGSGEIIGDLTILEGEDVEDFVMNTTGLPYSRMRNPLDWVYIKKDDLYIFEHGDTNKTTVEVGSGYVEDGVYTIRYRHNNWWGENADCDYDVCFKKNGDYYCFISNTPDMDTKASSDYIFPESNSRNLKTADVSGMDAETLRIGRNEIYARHGRKFKDSALQSYFNRKSWYSPTNDSDSKIENSLNQYEKNNIQFILSYESKARTAGEKTQTSGSLDSKTQTSTSGSSGSGSQKSASGYTNAELCKMAQDYYERHNNYRPPIAEIDSTDGNNVTIHLYEDMGDHVATSAWYVIDKTTGKGYDDIFGNKVDLSK